MGDVCSPGGSIPDYVRRLRKARRDAKEYSILMMSGDEEAANKLLDSSPYRNEILNPEMYQKLLGQIMFNLQGS